MKYICENCKNEHDGQYGSGRFCSSKCARGFSTKEKRSLINEKVSKKRKESAHKNVHKKCVECGNYFSIGWDKREQETCSRKCARKRLNKNPNYIKKLSISAIRAHQEGKMKGSKKTIRCNYLFENKFIRCDSKVEYVCLDYFVKNYKVIDISRCNFFIEYMFDDKIKRYLPDFLIKTDKETYVVECKSYFKITKDVQNSKSWSTYYNTIEPKKYALKTFCNKNGYKDFFFTKNLHRRFYDSLNKTHF